ncbi:hypothetical protein N7526_009012 [Penicillium atrosanguineum]|nr:hypothetical protein N7526_009012 [Penicillium atrosanguineum]
MSQGDWAEGGEHGASPREDANEKTEGQIFVMTGLRLEGKMGCPQPQQGEGAEGLLPHWGRWIFEGRADLPR